jgi:hypothetical protein
LGIKLYLERASWTGTYTLKFATYRGKDRTSDQTANLLIRLSPKLDSLLNVKEINSLSQYKNVYYVVYKNRISTHYIPGLPIPEGFDRRSLVVEAPDIYFDPSLPGYDAKEAAFREQVARNTIANHVYIQSVDGQISQQIGYKFGDDYYLGDIIELEGFTGVLSKARVTEYIRSQDQFGAQEYPTLAVLDPLFTGYMPDLEPNSDFDPDWTEDPDFDFNFDTNDPAKDPRNDPEVTPSSDSDPRDPIDHNPDPEHIFPAEDGGSSGYDEAYVGGLLEIHPDNYVDDSRDAPSWYQHHDRIYLEGYLIYANSGDPGGMITTAGGVPEEARPATTITATVYPDMPDSDSLYGHFTTFTGTITPAGTITISPAPPTYDEGFPLYLLLANISWPVNPPVDLGADTVDSEPLTPWLIQHLGSDGPEGSPTTSAQNATIGGHGTRVHLGGEVTLVSGTNGNLIQSLPGKYCAPHDDSIAVPGGGGWYSAFNDKDGFLTFKQQKSKPLLRAVNLTDWRLGTPWVYGEALTNEGIGPLEFWGGPAPEAPMYISGRWTPPLSNEVGTEFGFTITYTKSAPDGGQITYKLGAMKMGPEHNNEWWMMLEFWRIFLAGDPESTLEQGQMPMGRLDRDGAFQGMLPGPVNMNVSIQPFGTPGGVPHIQIATNLGGTKYGFELPQSPDDVAPVWPSQIGASNGWGAFYSLAGGQPVSTLYSITADYFSTPATAPNGAFYPPNWLPNHGYVQDGAQFDLDGVGWRVPPIPPTP